MRKLSIISFIFSLVVATTSFAGEITQDVTFIDEGVYITHQCPSTTSEMRELALEDLNMKANAFCSNIGGISIEENSVVQFSEWCSPETNHSITEKYVIASAEYICYTHND